MLFYCYAPKKKHVRKSNSNASRPVLPKNQISAANSLPEFFGKQYCSYEQMRLHAISASIAKMVDEGFAKKKPKSRGIAKSEPNPAQTYDEYCAWVAGKSCKNGNGFAYAKLKSEMKNFMGKRNGHSAADNEHGSGHHGNGGYGGNGKNSGALASDELHTHLSKNGKNPGSNPRA